MLQDVEARRRTEIDYLNGGIVRFGRELGVPTPLNEAIAALIKGIEASWTQSSTRRYANVRAAMAEHDLDALIVSGSEYSGFEGSVTYLSGFQIVHRYAYVVVPADGEPLIVFPTEARYVGEHGTAQLEQVFADRPGRADRGAARGRGLEADRRLRPRLHHDRARLPRPRRVSTSCPSTSSSTSRARSRARPSSSRCARPCASTSAASRSSSTPTSRGGPRPR